MQDTVMSDKHHEWIQTQSGLDIIGITMDFQAGRKTASETMESIAKYAEISFSAGEKQGRLAGIKEV